MRRNALIGANIAGRLATARPRTAARQRSRSSEKNGLDGRSTAPRTRLASGPQSTTSSRAEPTATDNDSVKRVRVIYSGRFGQCLPGSLGDLVRSQILLMSGELPFVAERISDRPVPIAVKLVLDGRFVSSTNR